MIIYKKYFRNITKRNIYKHRFRLVKSKVGNYVMKQVDHKSLTMPHS